MDQADDILTSFKLSSTQLQKYDTVTTKFDEHFAINRNVIFERAKLTRRRQEDETADVFITALQALSERCNFGEVKDEPIRNRIVGGLKDSKLSEKLQLDPDLALAKATNQASRSEAVKNNKHSFGMILKNRPT